ncbi:DnaD domain-containing protein [Anoxybacteroides tepidamans]|uniref:DnaD domain-containing protein n=1 Tax=Anoxybacteroides tepidamans TaxID=265948 RepID=UPI0004856CBD|nr:DnaD domain protein [Anoxybacillus tepidamans]
MMRISPQLACQIGLNESIVLSEIHRLLQEARTDWVMLTYEEWQRIVPFWSTSTIRRVIKKLERLGYLESANLNKNKIDQTKSYRINYEELRKQNIVLNDQTEHFEQIGRSTDHAEQANGQNDYRAQQMDQPANDRNTAQVRITQCEQGLLGHDPATRATDELGRCASAVNEHLDYLTAREKYFPRKSNIVLNAQLTNEQTEQQENGSNHSMDYTYINQKEMEKKTVFDFYQQYHFYPYNEYIQQQMNKWIDEMNGPLVLEALKTALEYGSTSWKYVEKVLLDWRAKRYQTVEDVKHAKRRKQRRFVSVKRAPVRTELVPDWLKEYQKQWEAPSPPEPPVDVEALRERLKKYR